MTDEQEKEDFFEKIPDGKPKKEKPPKKPVYKPDDPRYYEEESKWEHLTPAPFRRVRIIVGCAVVIILFCFIYWFCLYFFTPYIDKAETYGYVESVQRQGTFFKTYEGHILPYRTLMDTTRNYEGDFVFSVNDVHLASELRKRQQTGVPVKVTYSVYRQRMPWRGETKVLITGVDSVNPRTLLPYDRRPEYQSPASLPPAKAENK